MRRRRVYNSRRFRKRFTRNVKRHNGRNRSKHFRGGYCF